MNKVMRPPTISELLAEATYPSLESIVGDAFAAVTPSQQLTVTESAVKYSRVASPGGYSKPWDLLKTPYLQEPQDILTSLEHQGMIFAGPARTGKSMMALNWLGHTAISDAADMLYIHMDKDNARKWSKTDLDRFLEASSEVRARQLVHRSDDNTFDKTFDSGMRLMIAYPTVQNVSSVTVGRGWIFDYDRGSDDVGGEGNLFDLLQMRGTTMGRFAMAAAESSPNPNKEITDPKWAPETPHQAPPIRGIFELYNRGDRRRWHWMCPQCGEAFEPDFSLLKYADTEDIMEASETTYMACPNGGCVIEPGVKVELNNGGRWVKEGLVWTPQNTMEPLNSVSQVRSSIASFWLKGPAAAYQDWGKLVEKQLRAEKAYKDTGDEGPLRKTVTTDQGMYYIAKSRLSERSPEDLKGKAEFWGSSAEAPTVPEGVRFLIATVDVQAYSFVVQINGFAANGDIVVIDSFKIRWSPTRVDLNSEKLPLEPPVFAEDWDVLKDDVLLRTYALADNSGRHMRVRAMGCDSGGRAGTTTQAYAYWRKLRGEPDGLHRRLILVKGDGDKRTVSSRPRAKTSWPDSHKTDKFAAARGDVPVVMLNSNVLKDQLAGMLARRAGQDSTASNTTGGMIRYPNWTEDWFYRQMTNEIRTDKGWTNPAQRRNEVFDLSYYAIGVAVRPMEQGVPTVHFGFDRMDFDNPPGWAAEWDENDLVFGGTAPEPEPDPSPKSSTLSALGGKLS